MKTVVQELFESYFEKVGEPDPAIREKCFASFVAGVMLTSKVVRESKNHKTTQNILNALDKESLSIAVKHMEKHLGRINRGN